MEPVLFVHDQDFVRVITLHRPQRMNSFDMELSCALRGAVVAASNDKQVRAIVIAGHGANFCSGADVRRDRSIEQAAGIDLIDVLQEVLLILRHGEKPSFAAVQGNVLGAGLSLMLACDFVIADDTAKFGAPFTNVGLTPDIGIVITLPERVGIGIARDMLLCATVKKADEALSIGLVDAVCEAGQVLVAVMAKAATFADRAPLAIASARRLLNMTRDDESAVLRDEKAQQNFLRSTRDAKEAITAFTQKRKAVFSGT